MIHLFFFSRKALGKKREGGGVSGFFSVWLFLSYGALFSFHCFSFIILLL